MIGRDMSASESRGHVVAADADVTVGFGETAVSVDVEFTDIVNVETDNAPDDMAWSGIAAAHSFSAYPSAGYRMRAS